MIHRPRPGEANRVEADERGTYLFDAKDLCALPVLDRLVATGVQALKIEGRTRSEHYVGAVIDVYRDALDRIAAGDLEGFRARQEAYLAELARPAYRGSRRTDGAKTHRPGRVQHRRLAQGGREQPRGTRGGTGGRYTCSCRSATRSAAGAPFEVRAPASAASRPWLARSATPGGAPRFRAVRRTRYA